MNKLVLKGTISEVIEQLKELQETKEYVKEV